MTHHPRRNVQTGAEGWDSYVEAGRLADVMQRHELANERFSEMTNVNDMFGVAFSRQPT